MLAHAVSQGDSPRLRSTLQNGATIFVERVAGAQSLAIAITANSRACPEAPKTNGLRHLLEHLMARGPKLDIDRRLESVGGFLSASTYREVMQFSIVVPLPQAELGFRAAFDVLAVPNPPAERIKAEANIIREEMALRESPEIFADAAWSRFSGQSLSPVGDPEVLQSATRDELVVIYKAQFDAKNVVLSVVGDFDVDQMMRQATKYLQVLPLRETPVPKVVSEPTRSVTLSVPGYALAVDAGSFSSTKAAFSLAAGLALASTVDDSYAFYTPSASRSLIVVGTKTDARELRANATKYDPRILFSRGRQLALNWIQRKLSTPQSIAEFRGMIACLQVDFRPESMQNAVSAMTLEEFSRALARFKPSECIEVVGP